MRYRPRKGALQRLPKKHARVRRSHSSCCTASNLALEQNNIVWLPGCCVMRCKLPGCLRVIHFEPGAPAADPRLKNNPRGKYKARIGREFCKGCVCKLPLAGRIILVCDTFHAMTSDRPPLPQSAERRSSIGRTQEERWHAVLSTRRRGVSEGSRPEPQVR
jgi:hypothetical protein